MRNIDAAPERPVKALQCYLAYISAFIAGAVMWWYLQNRLESLLWVGFISTCCATIVVWIYSISNSNSSIYDPYWVIAPPIIATAFLFVSRRFDPRSMVIVALFWMWSFRYHIFYAWSGWRTGLIHEDWRYENMRTAPVPYWLNSLLGMHLFPTVLVYLAFVPPAIVLLETTPARQALGVWDFIAGVCAVTAVMIEYVADRQLGRYRKTEEYRNGGTLRRGLWAVSRHPNYFGETLFWISLALFTVSSGIIYSHSFQLIGAGPVFMAAFFRYSCRLTDKRSLERRPGYEVVMKEVSAMVPWIPKKPK